MLHQGAIWTVADDAYLIAYSTSDFRQTSKTLINWKNSLDKKPRFRFARNHAGLFYLACMANCQVVIVDQNGEIRNTAGAGYGRAFDQFAQPAGLTHDSVGNFIIAGENFPKTIKQILIVPANSLRFLCDFTIYESKISL